LAKSVLVVGNVDNVAKLADIFNYKTSSLPLKYLGMPLGACFKNNCIWDGIVEKMKRWLASWKRLYLSKAGKVTLIKSILSNLPKYLSLFPIPVSVANWTEKLQRDFLWGVLGKEFKNHLVGWVKVCTLISEEGLGIKTLRVFNCALLGQWLWDWEWCGVEGSGGFEIGQLMGRVVLSWASKSLWGGCLEEHQKRVRFFLKL
jgi:hypothetical protein